MAGGSLVKISGASGFGKRPTRFTAVRLGRSPQSSGFQSSREAGRQELGLELDPSGEDP